MTDTPTIDDLGYSAFLANAGLTEDRVQQLMSELPSPIENDAVDDGFRLAPSAIQGFGMLAARPVSSGEIFPVCNGAVRYHLARYVNHSDTPNAVLHFDEFHNGWMTMTSDLDEGEEVTMDYGDNLPKSLEVSSTFIPTSEQIAAASFMDRAEYEITQMPPVDIPLIHLFTPGLYVRQMSAPAGALITSVEHKTEHPWILLKGVLDVISDTERIRYTAPCVGVTLPGTKRLAYIHEDIVWITFHANPQDHTDPEVICEEITVPMNNPLLDKDDPRVELWRKSPEVKFISETQTQKITS